MYKYIISSLLFISVSAFSSELKEWPAPDCASEPEILASNNPASLGARTDDSNLTIFGLNVPKNKMSEIDDPLPPAVVSNDRPGCASCSVYACYLSNDKSVALIFYKYTSWDLQGFEILQASDNNLPKRCIQTELKGTDFKTESGIGVGSTEDFVADKLNIERAKGELVFHHRIKLSQKYIVNAASRVRSRNEPKCSDYYFDASTNITAEYDINGLTRYKVIYMEMY